MGRSSVVPRKRIPVSQDNRQYLTDTMAYEHTFDETIDRLQDEMEDMTYDEKMEDIGARVRNGMEGFQEALAAITEMTRLQDERIEELQSTVKRETCREASFHTAMLLVCLLFYIYGSFFGLYMCRK